MKTRISFLGFTLIELLVVIAIISLLVSILLPSLTKAKFLAQRTLALSNARSIGLGMILYCEDNDQWFPNCYGNLAANPNLCDKLAEYCDSPEVFRDPGDERYFDLLGTSYAYCSWYAGFTNQTNTYQQRLVVCNYRADNIVEPMTKATVRDFSFELGCEKTGILLADSHVEQVERDLFLAYWWRPCDEN